MNGESDQGVDNLIPSLVERTFSNVKNKEK